MQRRKQATENTQKFMQNEHRKQEMFYKTKRRGRKQRALKEWAQLGRPRTLIGLSLASNFGENTNRRFEANTYNWREGSLPAAKNGGLVVKGQRCDIY